MRPYVEELSQLADTHLCVYPNAGLPDPLSATGFPETPQTLAPQIRDWAETPRPVYTQPGSAGFQIPTGQQVGVIFPKARWGTGSGVKLVAVRGNHQVVDRMMLVGNQQDAQGGTQ